MGRSALLVFAALAAKVLLFDLSGASPLVRIGCLVVLGVTMYVGGILYQKVDAPPPKSVGVDYICADGSDIGRTVTSGRLDFRVS